MSPFFCFPGIGLCFLVSRVSTLTFSFYFFVFFYCSSSFLVASLVWHGVWRGVSPSWLEEGVPSSFDLEESIAIATLAIGGLSMGLTPKVDASGMAIVTFLLLLDLQD